MFDTQIPGVLKISFPVEYLRQLYHIERTVLRTVGTVSNRRSEKGYKTSLDHLTPLIFIHICECQEFVLTHTYQHNINDPSSPYSRSSEKYPFSPEIVNSFLIGCL